MADFLEERLSDLIRYGSSYQDDYAVNVVRTAGGQEYRALVHPYPTRRFDVSYMLDAATTYAELMGVYHRAHGQFAGFRARCFDEWSSNGAKGAPTAFDQDALYVSAGVYQLIKVYGADHAAGASGYPYRQIKKPVAGTCHVAIGGIEMTDHVLHWSVDSTTGRLTFPVDGSGTISGISKAANAVVTFSGSSGSFSSGQTVYFSGVSGMTQINGVRGKIVSQSAGSITVDINSTAFSTWTSSGVFNTRPQPGESVTCGFEFDFPVRFSTALPVGQDYPGYRPVDGVSLVELLNP